MPIVFSCPCGKQLRVKDEYAGKSGKCPACGNPVKIPTASIESHASNAPTPPPLSKKPPPIPSTPAASVAATDTKPSPCPGCNNPLPAGAVFCVKCGMDLRTGQRIRTVME